MTPEPLEYLVPVGEINGTPAVRFVMAHSHAEAARIVGDARTGPVVATGRTQSTAFETPSATEEEPELSPPVKDSETATQ